MFLLQVSKYLKHLFGLFCFICKYLKILNNVLEGFVLYKARKFQVQFTRDLLLEAL